MKITSIAQLTSAINTGVLDNDLSTISRAIKLRRDSLSNHKLAEISCGDTVYFGKDVRPEYLFGKPAKVVKINQKSIVVNLIYPAGRFSSNIRTPISFIITNPV